jgi:hypothetical protein
VKPKTIYLTALIQDALLALPDTTLMETLTLWLDQADDIRKEARRRGLVERINVLLQERNFHGDLIN